MSNGHTPGPWCVESGAHYRAVRTGGEVIANMREIGGCFNEANARLISAAPDLLEALEMIVAEADSYTARTGKPVYNWLDQARAAIAKARGTPC